MDEDGNETTQELHFFYDAQSRPAFVEYGGVMYRYVYNLQGDIVAIVDEDGNAVVEYKYDAWGMPIAVIGNMANALGHRNPFRYRGYIYDEEPWMYWLMSRYYYPELHRFINTDIMLGNVSECLSHNAFVYAKCRPVMRVDRDGRKDVIYSSYDSFVVENDTFAHNFFYSTQYYVEVNDVRYLANSEETISLYEWTALDTDFMESEFDSLIEGAASYSSLSDVLAESVGGKLDFKLKLDKNMLYLMNGVVYNANEAGNFIWAYFLKVHNFIDVLGGAFAQAGSIVSGLKKGGTPRFDEAHDRAARYAGLKYWYQQRKKSWLFRLMYGELDKV